MQHHGAVIAGSRQTAIMGGSTYITKQTIISYVTESPSILRSMPACKADEVNVEIRGLQSN